MAERKTRIEQSNMLICNALWTMMEEKPFSDISISELCQAATVSRNTFYRRFKNLEDVIDFYLEKKTIYIITQFYLLDSYDLRRPSRSDLERTYHRFFQFWYEQRRILHILHDQELLHLLDKAFLKTINITGPQAYGKLSNPSDPEFFADYFYFWHATSLSHILEKWVIRGCRESIEELTNITIWLYQTVSYQWE